MVRVLLCVFWLMIVYAAILTHGTFRLSALDLRLGLGSGTGSGEAGPGSSGPSGVANPDSLALVGTIAAGTATFCARRADECLADARQLTALLAETGAQTLHRGAAADDDPMPVRDPRRKRRDAKSARTP